MRAPAATLLAAVLLAAATASRATEVTVEVTGSSGSALQHVAVWLEPAGGLALPAPRRATVDQVDRESVPPVSVVQSGAVARFPNSDNIRHHVYSFSPARTFELKLYSGREAPPVVFDQPGLVVLGCNIHDHMIAWIMVVDSAWFGVTDAQGSLRITGLPPGDWRLRAWHPGMSAAPVDRPLSLGSDGQVLRLALDAGALPRPAHPGGP